MKRCARTTSTTVNGETVTKRRISWEALWKIRPDLKPANDNEWRRIAARHR